MNNTTEKIEMQELLKELREIEARVSAIIARLESENKTTVTTVAEVRRLAILEEIYRAGGSVTAKQIADFAKKYGKTPSSTAGYYSGRKPSLVATDDRTARKLTKTGIEIVMKMREKCGEDWLDKVPLEVVGNEYTPDTEVFL